MSTVSSERGTEPKIQPMRQQYLDIKARYPDTILFFRLGDFYETFDEDATTASEVLDIVLTSREMGRDLRIPMAGIPFHSADSYIARLITAGHKVAICEQIGEASKGRKLVDRDVTKVITPGTVVDPSMLDAHQNNDIVGLVVEGKRAGIALARTAGYSSAGTVEFLVADGAFFFIEMNTRIQVEHPITELVTGIDLVAQQLRIAGGETLPVRQEDIEPRGHAVECRINAEDPDNDFMPAPGRIDALEVPGGPGVRVDHALNAGAAVVPFYDSLVAKLCAWGSDRQQALARARQALTELRIDGVATTAALHHRLLDTPEVQSGDYDTTWLEHYLA